MIKQLVAGTTVRTAAELVGVNRNTATLYCRKLRERIAEHLERPPSWPLRLTTAISAPGQTRAGSRRQSLWLVQARWSGLCAGHARRATLLLIIKETIKPDSIVYTDGFSAYDALDVSDTCAALVEDRNHINGIENFWNQAKHHRRRDNAIPRDQFPLFLKECEWRFNYRPTANFPC